LVSAGTAEVVGDVAKASVDALFASSGVARMIHGHTHRPAIHDEGHGRTRIVLGDWYEQGSVLRVSEDGVELASL
jgi:UDP-2,3-diacylglucosamine hydrolase